MAGTIGKSTDGTFGACFRFDKERGIYLHVNDTHTGYYIEGFEVDGSGFLAIYHGSPFAEPALDHLVVGGDETISGTLGCIAGGSGGVGRTRVRIYSTKHARPLHLGNRADLDFISGPVSNIWLSWKHVDRRAVASEAHPL